MPDTASPNVRNARRLLAGGAIGGHAAALLLIGVFLVVGGVNSGVSAALAAAVTLAFNVIGMAVQLRVADAPAKLVLFAALASYAVRVSVLGIVLMVVLANADKVAFLDPIAVVVTTIGVVIGWLALEFWTFSRLRIPVFDPPDQ